MNLLHSWANSERRGLDGDLGSAEAFAVLQLSATQRSKTAQSVESVAGVIRIKEIRAFLGCCAPGKSGSIGEEAKMPN